MAKKTSTTRNRTRTTTRRAASNASARTTSRASARPIKPTRLTLPAFHVDAFTGRVFHGNPAAVVLLDGKWLPDEVMHSIAAEHNLSETAFVLRGKGRKLGLRWFTPTVEVPLCGHATLASAHVLWRHASVKDTKLVFATASGDLPVTRNGELITLDFPALPARPARITDELCAALGHEPIEVHRARYIMAVFDNKRLVHEMQPDFALLAALDAPGVIVTAPGSGHDFVSRFFTPAQGVSEDPVTGSAHCTLAPYWAEQLGKTHLWAHQVSHRGGELWCEVRRNRVLISGHAVTFSRSTISV